MMINHARRGVLIATVMIMMIHSVLSLTTSSTWKTPLISTLRTRTGGSTMAMPSSVCTTPTSIVDTLSSSSPLLIPTTTTTASKSSSVTGPSRMKNDSIVLEKKENQTKHHWMEWKWVGMMLLVSSTTALVVTTSTTTSTTMWMMIGEKFWNVLVQTTRKILWMEAWMYLSNTMLIPQIDKSSSLEQYLPKWLYKGVKKLFLRELERTLEKTIIQLWTKFRTTFLSPPQSSPKPITSS